MSLQMVLGSLTVCVSLLFCLKIKSSKKDPAIMGTEGTIYRIKDVETSSSTEDEPTGSPSPPKKDVKTPPAPPQPQPQPQHSRSGSKLTPPNRNNNGGSTSNVSPEAAHILNASSNRTPSRSGERKLPDIPRQDPRSNLYATVQDARHGEQGEEDEEEEEELEEEEEEEEEMMFVENSDSETELGPKINTHHPYAKVKKNKVIQGKSLYLYIFSNVLGSTLFPVTHPSPFFFFFYLSSRSSIPTQPSKRLQPPPVVTSVPPRHL